MKKLQSLLSAPRTWVLSLSLLAVVAIAIIGCIKTETEPKKSLNIKSFKTYIDGRPYFTEYPTYDDKDRIIKIRAVGNAGWYQQSEKNIVRSADGIITKMEEIYKETAGNIVHERRWEMLTSNAMGKPLTAKYYFKPISASANPTTTYYTYQYNTNGQLIKKIEPDYTFSFTYNQSGKIQTATAYGSTNNFSFDSNGNLKNTNYITNEFSDIKAPNWFIFDGDSQYFTTYFEPAPRYFISDGLDKSIAKNLLTGINYKFGSNTGTELSVTYVYDEHKRPTKITMQYPNLYPTAFQGAATIINEITYID